MLAHQWYIFAFSPDAFFARALRLVTEPLQLAPDFFTLPGLLLPFFLPSAKFSFALLLPTFLKPNLLFGPVPVLCIKPMGLMLCGIIMNSCALIQAYLLVIVWSVVTVFIESCGLAFVPVHVVSCLLIVI
jgi:hypothetical protein